MNCGVRVLTPVRVPPLSPPGLVTVHAYVNAPLSVTPFNNVVAERLEMEVVFREKLVGLAEAVVATSLIRTESPGADDEFR